MLICVTGGTGFVGAHSAAAIVRSGHRVRIMARDPATVENSLAAFDIGADVEVVDGDVTDEASVARACKGADAALHAASVYSFDSRRHADIRATNVRGTEVVLAAAAHAGLDPIVHVSTFGAMLPSSTPALTVDSPLGAPREVYMASKAEADAIARRHQSGGAPVQITYLPALLGPDDPKVGDQTTRLRNVLRGLMPMWPTGALPIGDVRDAAALHATLFSSSPPAGNRHFGPGHYLTTRQYVGAIRAATGRRLPTMFLPAALMNPVGRAADVAQRIWPWHIPAEYGAIYACAEARPLDYGSTGSRVEPRPIHETITDTVTWLITNGHVTSRQAGSLPGMARRAYS
jgi:dihydroflavonol-4-reductase